MKCRHGYKEKPKLRVSIDELTAKAKIEMVRVGKSGKVFGNKD